MESFSLEIPTKVYFGRNRCSVALKAEKNKIGNRTVIITTGGFLEKSGYLAELKQLLKETSAEVIIYNKISPNPELDEVIKALMIAKEYRADSIIGFGGGSAMDAAKAVACGMACGKPIDEYYYRDIAPEAAIPMIAIPTTAGTGSELSKGAIISDHKTNQKKGIRGVNVYPKVAIIDSRFTEQIPRNVTMETGFDVFAHAIESFVSIKASWFSTMLSIEAIRIVGENLTKLSENIEAVDAREPMSYASMIMGVNLGNTGNALPHRLQYPIGAATGTSHAAGLLALYPAWLKYEYKYSAEKIDKAATVLSGKECRGIDQSLGEIMNFIENLGVRKNLRQLGLESIQNLYSQVSGNLTSDPAFAEESVVKKIYKDAFDA